MADETVAVVVTACGKRKSLDPHPSLRAAALEPGDCRSVADRWAAQVQAAGPCIPIDQLYSGRAFREAKLAASALAAPLYVISAGLGLVPSARPAPAYCLTVAPGADSILSKLEGANSSPAAWWEELCSARGTGSLKDLLDASSGPLLVAAGASYLAMVGPELAALPPSQQARLRLFTATARQALPAGLQNYRMPYDRRLEGLADGRSGTMSDFAQRALRHFAEAVVPANPNGDADAHAEAVSLILRGIDVPPRRRGNSLSDDEIIALIRLNLSATGGKSAAMLRLLRDSFQVACEQTRFKKLFAAASAKLAA